MSRTVRFVADFYRMSRQATAVRTCWRATLGQRQTTRIATGALCRAAAFAAVLVCVPAALTASSPALAECRDACSSPARAEVTRDANRPLTATRSRKNANANIMKKKIDTSQTSTSNMR